MIPKADERYSRDGRATTTMKTKKNGSKEGNGGASPSHRIDARIKELCDWRGEVLALQNRIIAGTVDFAPLGHAWTIGWQGLLIKMLQVDTSSRIQVMAEVVERLGELAPSG